MTEPAHGWNMRWCSSQGVASDDVPRAELAAAQRLSPKHVQGKKSRHRVLLVSLPACLPACFSQQAQSPICCLSQSRRASSSTFALEALVRASTPSLCRRICPSECGDSNRPDSPGGTRECLGTPADRLSALGGDGYLSSTSPHDGKHLLVLLRRYGVCSPEALPLALTDSQADLSRIYTIRPLQRASVRL